MVPAVLRACFTTDFDLEAEAFRHDGLSRRLERAARIELATLGLEDRCSTSELYPQSTIVLITF